MKGNKRGLFSSIKITKKPDEVYKQLVAIINSGQIRPGEKLPSERELALDLGISRQSIREAIYRAQSIGLIEVRQGEGSFVLSSVKETLKSPMKILLKEEAEKIFDFLEMRKVIEGWCAERAAITANAEDLKEIKEILQRMEALVPTDSRWEKEDTDFHLSIAAATKNVIAMHIMQALKDSFQSYFRVRRIATTTDRKGPLMNQHTEIYKAISHKDPRLSKEKTLQHLDFIEKLIIEDMQKASRKIN